MSYNIKTRVTQFNLFEYQEDNLLNKINVYLHLKCDKILS